MTEAPERIWVNLDDCEDGCCPVEDGLDGDGKFFRAATSTRYIRADLVPQWQPIETAPKDGTWVLVWSYSRVAVSFFCEKENEWCSDWQDYQEHYNNESPTHWMPLPAPPVP
jgi:hypothetical protein